MNLASVGDRYLNRVGTIRNTSVELDTIVWPGNTIVGPMFKERNTYMIVTKVAPPFVVRQTPYTDDGRCFSKHPCLQVHTSDHQVLKQIMLNYQSDGESSALNYTKYCCSGLSIDLMEKLAADLDFNFMFFFASDNEYGTITNGSWSGMMGYMVDGAMDMMIGSFGITDSKLRYVDFTEPYYYSGFSMVSVAIERNTSMTAFLEPFSITVWLCIFLFATVTAIATSLFEWNSPFGLNPWGRKRKRNYTLGSGINMVYSVLFGHTISTKPPKCWPSKVLQNSWAGLAIFIVASYTANLAAFLAGRSQTVLLHSIFDTKVR